MVGWKQKCMYMLVGAATVYTVNRWRQPICFYCHTTIQKSAAAVQSKGTKEKVNLVRQWVRPVEFLKRKAHDKISAAINCVLSCFPGRSHGESDIVVEDALTRHLRSHVDKMFSQATILASNPVKPNIIDRNNLEFVLDEDRRPVKLGAGDMGTVYIARLIDVGLQVAVKVATSDIVTFEYTVHEASLQTHLNACKVAPFCHGLLALSALEAQGQAESDLPHAAIVMDIVGGSTNTRAVDLSAYIEQLREQDRNKLDERHLSLLFRKLALKLDKIHEQGVAVNDIKGENVLVAREKNPEDGSTNVEPYFIDFGVGRWGVYDFQLTDEVRRAADCYKHVAPELLRLEDPQEEVTPFTDIYSFGKMLDQAGHLLDVMVLQECGMFCTRSVPRLRPKLSKVADILQRTRYSAVLEEIT